MSYTCKERTGIGVPYLGAAVFEELEELRDHDVERPVQHVAVQDFSGVLTDLLQCSKRPLQEKGEHYMLPTACQPQVYPNQLHITLFSNQILHSLGPRWGIHNETQI